MPVLPPACKPCCSLLPQGPHSCLTTPHPASRKPTWSNAEASDDANHAGDSNVAHPGQGGLRGDMGLGDATEVVALSFAPSIPKAGLHVCRMALGDDGHAGHMGEMQTSNWQFGAKLVGVSLSKAQHLMVLRCSQSSMKISQEQAAEKSITLQTLHHSWHFTLPPSGKGISAEKLPEVAGFFSSGFGFSLFLFFVLNFPSLLPLKGKLC